MNILIPLCGKGERFLPENKPFVPVYDKTILKHVVDSLGTSAKIHIIVNNRTYHEDLNSYGTVINIESETDGATETIYGGLSIAADINAGGVLVVDGDNFYGIDIVNIVKQNPEKNQVFSFIDTQDKPHYSYVTIDEECRITDIKEKESISPYANTGAYYFADVNELKYYSEYVLAERLYFKGEPYISSVISSMLKENHTWYCNIIPATSYFSLGTPAQVQAYKKSTYAFLFDMDGTLVETDAIYYKVWDKILSTYNIYLTKDIYKTYIYSNSDEIVKESLMKNVEIALDELSKLKDTYFEEFIGELKTISGAVEFIRNVKSRGHKIAVVTNSNRHIAELILKTIDVISIVDVIVIGSECNRPKPYADPYIKAQKYFNIDNKKCIIFEDSPNGLLSAKGISPKCIIGIGLVGADHIIANYDDLTVDTVLEIRESVVDKYVPYITKSLRRRFKDIHDVLISPISLKGGFIADVMSVKFSTGGLEHDAIFKVENNNESMLNKVAHELDLYGRENYFYETISHHINIDIPDFYGLVRDDSYNVIGIMLESLNKPDHQLNMDLNKETIEPSLAVINSMAKMHASFWGRNLDMKFKMLRKNTDYKWDVFVNERVDGFLEKWKHVLSETQVELTRKIARDFQQIETNLSVEPLTLIHGDVKSPNIFFRGGVVPVFIDWQYICYGKGIQDIVFFMIESFSKEKLRLYYPIFKHYYYAKLQEYGVQNYTIIDYEADFKNACVYFPFFVAMWFGTTATEDLIDVNFPYFFIDRLYHFYDIVFST